MSAAAVYVYSPLPANQARLASWLAPVAAGSGRDCRVLAAPEALWSALATEPAPGLLVLDGHPADDSYPLINRLQADARAAQLPIILLTDNLADGSRRFYGELLQGLEWLAKPVTATVLAMRVEACLALDDARRAITAALPAADWQQTLSEGLLGLDEGGQIRYANPQAARWLRLSPLALCRLNVQSLLPEAVLAPDQAWGGSRLAQAAQGQLALTIRQLSLWRGDGGSLPVEAALVALPGGPFPQLLAFRARSPGAAGSQAQAESLQLDWLTGLPTKAYLEAVLPERLPSGAQALLMLDIDHLRHINATLGHDLGDQLLRAAAARLRQLQEDGLLVALAGGRFALLAPAMADYRAAGRLAQRLQAQFRLPFLLAGHEVFCSISIGIALYPTGADDAGQLLQAAERALQRAKTLGRNVIQFDAAVHNHFSLAQLERETAFHQALQAGALSLVWQDWCGQDEQCLLRQPQPHWPAVPQLAARELWQLAEDCGRSRELGDWLFRQAVGPDQGRPAAAPRLVLTVPMAQLLDTLLLPRLRAGLARQGLRPERLLLLLPWRENEAGFLQQQLSALAAEGVGLALRLDGPVSLSALLAVAWEGVMLGPGVFVGAAAMPAVPLLASLAAIGRQQGWQLYVDELPPGMSLRELYGAGVAACVAAPSRMN